MVQRNFLAVPVLQHSEHRYYGFLVLADIVREVVRRFGQEKLRSRWLSLSRNSVALGSGRGLVGGVLWSLL